jgi:AraC-like DNA-binding protein
LPHPIEGDPSWHRLEIRRIDDLGNAVLGAALEPVQMAGHSVSGSLAHMARDGVIFSTGSILGRVAIYGWLPKDAITLSLGLRLGPGSRQWLNDVSEGHVGIVLPGDLYDAVYVGDSLYVAASLTEERLEEEVWREGVATGQRLVSRSGLSSQPLDARRIAWLAAEFARIHDRRSGTEAWSRGADRAMLRAVVSHCARNWASGQVSNTPVGHAKIVHRAREYIRENLASPISLDALARVAATSRRTLARAFLEVLQDSPGTYVRRLRLHRIRWALASEVEARCTVSMITARWGIREHGRMAGWYRELFGEYPSTTMASSLTRQRFSFF